MADKPSIEELQAKYPGAETYTFGDTREICEMLLKLVRSGKKRATCEALSVYESGSEAMPVVGRRDINLEWDGSPALVTETTELTIRRFCDVEADFALAEGENESLEGWQEDHRAYFERSGNFDPEMKLVCERFEVVEDFGATGKET